MFQYCVAGDGCETSASVEGFDFIGNVFDPDDPSADVSRDIIAQMLYDLGVTASVEETKILWKGSVSEDLRQTGGQVAYESGEFLAGDFTVDVNPGATSGSLSYNSAFGNMWEIDHLAVILKWGDAPAPVFLRDGGVLPDPSVKYAWTTPEALSSITIAAPIPAALPFLGTAVLGLGAAAWRKRRAA